MNNKFEPILIIGIILLLGFTTIGCTVNTHLDASPNKVTLNVNATQQLTVIRVPGAGMSEKQVDVTTQCTYESSDPAIAKVSKDGIITGISAGSATITASAADAASADIPVTVK
jgi:large repetitive protein